jgi:hypothetical protein
MSSENASRAVGARQGDDGGGKGLPARPALQAESLEESATLAATGFGVFRRFRSPAGTDVFPRGLPTRGARPIEVVPLAEALTRRWDDDRHVVLYTSDKPYRINNGALDKVQVTVRLLALDVDNHDDAPGWMAGERPKIAALLEAHPGAFVHTTRRGWRAYYALAAPVPIRSEADKDGFTLLYARVAGYLFERFGIVADDALTRWNQPIRLPHIIREGRAFDAEIIGGDARALGALELPEDVPSVPDLRSLAAVLPRWGSVAKRWQPKRELFRVASAAFDHVPLPSYADCVAAAERWAREEAPRAVMHHGGRATARSVAATLHVGFALQREDVERLLTGAYNRRRCSPPWSEEEIGELAGIAKGVVRTPIHVWGFMLTRDRTGIEAARATLAAAAESRDVVALDDVGARLVAAVEQHPAVVLRATYGAGKTYSMARYIATPTAATGRVIVVVSRHELARTWVKSLSAAGETDVAYHASVVKRRDEEGHRHCDNKIALKVYRHGGDVARDVCPSCPRAASCPAYNARPKATARVHVLPREMIGKLGVTDEDLVVFDDAAVDLLAWHRLRVRQLRRLTSADERILPKEQARFLRVFLDALLAGPRGAEARARAALVAASIDVEGGALRYVASRLVEGQRSPGLPPGTLAENGDELAETLRDVGRLREVLRFAAAYAEGAEVRWSEDSLTVHGESAAAKLLRTHGGRLVVLDAAANVEELRVLRSDLHVERLDVDDAGDATRVLLFAKHATRTALRDEGPRRRLLDLWIGAALERLTARGSRRPVFVAYKSIEAELRAHPAIAAWCAEDPRREVRVAHYGALRGSNRFRRCDAVVTLADPWLNGDDVTGRADWLGVDEPGYRVALATAELGQAHGRSRSVRRRRRLTHVHVGRLVPDGWGAGVVVEPIGGPPERSREPADRIEFRALVGSLGGNRAVAALLGCSSSAVAGWAGGSRGLPHDALERVRTLAATRDKRTASSEGGRGRGGAERWGEPMDALACTEDLTGCVHASGVASGVLVGDEGARVCVGAGKDAEEAVGAALQARPPVRDVTAFRPLPEQNILSPIPHVARSEGDAVGESVPDEGLSKKVSGLAQAVAVWGYGDASGSSGGGVPQAASPLVGDALQSGRGAITPTASNAAGAAGVLAVLRQLAPSRASPTGGRAESEEWDHELAVAYRSDTAARARQGLPPRYPGHGEGERAPTARGEPPERARGPDEEEARRSWPEARGNRRTR